jgi:2'-deoxynucleoside 5'-phosphate N-hydrolase
LPKLYLPEKKKSMKIYFAGSIRGGREDAALYFQIIEYLKSFGEVLTEHIGDPQLTDLGDDGPTDRYIHDRDLEWLQSADIVVAEVTTISMGVGYEIGRAIESGKKVLCLFRPDSGKNLSAMIAGCPGLELVNYRNLADVKIVLANFLKPQIK